MTDNPYLQWPVFRRSVVAAFCRSLTARSCTPQKADVEAWYVNNTPTSSAQSFAFLSGAAGTYQLKLVVTDQLGALSMPATMSVVVTSGSAPAPPLNRAPVAQFSATDGSQIVLNGGTLSTVADPLTGQSRMTFQDHSTDPDGAADIVSWDWTVNTQSTPLCTGTRTCVWGFQPGGPYVVMLKVTDKAGVSRSAFINIDVAGSVISPIVSQVSPSSVIVGPNDQSIAFAGQNFQQGLQVVVDFPGGGQTVLSGTQISWRDTFDFTALVTFANPGNYKFSVHNPNGGVSAPIGIWAGGAEGAGAGGPLLQGVDGLFYGTTSSGGQFGRGAIFSMDPAGTTHVLQAFSGPDGAIGCGALAQAPDGTLYSTTCTGGAYPPLTTNFFLRDGTVFRFTSNAGLETIHSFSDVDGNVPWFGVTQAQDGAFYGTTRFGGSSGYGTVFRIGADC